MIKIMASWMTLDELGGTSTRRYFIGSSGMKETKKFIYWQPFGLHFRYRHQVYDHNNRRNALIPLDRTWATKFWPGRNFAWYPAVSEVNTALFSGHFQNYELVQTNLDFRRDL